MTGNHPGMVANCITWPLTGIALVFVSLRLACRVVPSKRIAGWDDAFMVFAALMLLASNISVSIAVSEGVGMHMNQLPPHDRINAARQVPIMNAIIISNVPLPKLGILALLQRIFNIPRYLVGIFWSLCISLVGMALSASVLCFWQCNPPSYQWDPRVSGTCMSITVLEGLLWAICALSAIIDLSFSLYPQFLIAKLNMPLRRKTAYGLALGLASFGFVLSVIKLVRFPRTFSQLRTDLSFAALEVDMLAMLEVDFLVITACLPTLGPFFRLIKRILGLPRRTRDEHLWTGRRTIGSREFGHQWHDPYSTEDIVLVRARGGQDSHRKASSEDPERQSPRSDSVKDGEPMPPRKKSHIPRHEIWKKVEIEQTLETRTISRETQRVEELGLSDP